MTDAEYRFPDGSVYTNGLQIFERVLNTRETATATQNAKGDHAGRVITYDEVSWLCRPQ